MRLSSFTPGLALAIGLAVFPVPAPAPTPTALPLGHYHPAPPRTFRGAGVSCCISTALLRRFISQHRAGFRACWIAALRRQPRHAGGRVLMSFTIGRSGRVIRTTVRRSGLRDASTEACLQAVFQRMRFPKPHCAVQVVYPMLF